MIRLRINGRDVELPGPTRLGDYLASLGVDQRAVAVELNERILERSELAWARWVSRNPQQRPIR